MFVGLALWSLIDSQAGLEQSLFDINFSHDLHLTLSTSYIQNTQCQNKARKNDRRHIFENDWDQDWNPFLAID